MNFGDAAAAPAKPLTWLDLIQGQKVRAFDMYALGPFMLWYAYKSKGMGAWPRRALFVSGVMTIYYNLDNYRKVKAVIESEFAQGQDPSQIPILQPTT
jgi:hypothetical protein